MNDDEPIDWTPADLKNYSRRMRSWHKARDFGGDTWRDCKRKERHYWIARAVGAFAWRLTLGIVTVAAVAVLVRRC